MLGSFITVANAQDRRDRDRNDEFGLASAQQVANADRRLNQIYQRRIADARADDRSDRRGRGWYSQEAALRANANYSPWLIRRNQWPHWV